MKPRMLQVMWLVKLDPMDPNLIVGDDLFHFTMFKDKMQEWRKGGVPIVHRYRTANGQLAERGYHGRVKWVFPLVVFGLWRDGPGLDHDKFFKDAQDKGVSTFSMKDD